MSYMLKTNDYPASFSPQNVLMGVRPVTKVMRQKVGHKIGPTIRMEQHSGGVGMDT